MRRRQMIELMEAISILNQSTFHSVRQLAIDGIHPRQALSLAKMLQLLESRNLLTNEMVSALCDLRVNKQLLKSTLRALDSLGLLNEDTITLIFIHANDILKMRLSLIDIDRHQLEDNIDFALLCRYLHQTPGIFTSFLRLNHSHTLSPETQLIAHQLTDILPGFNHFLYTLYHIDPTQNLIDQNNLIALFKLVPHANGALAALRAIDCGGMLTQEVFDEIVANPKQALAIAYRLDGIPYAGDIDATTSFVEIRKAARVLSQSMRSQHSVLFTLPNELLISICSKLANEKDLDEASALSLAYAYFGSPD